MQLTPVSASTAAQSSQLLNLFQQNSTNPQTPANDSDQAAQFNQLMNELDSMSGSTTAPTSTAPTSGTPVQTPVHHHHGHHHGSVAGGVSSASPSYALSAMLSQSGNLAQSGLPASMTTNTTALDPTSLFGA
jgi:hypothetical protein